MSENDPPYESPLKRQIEERLLTATPAMRELFIEALSRLDHTDPARVRERLPPRTLDVYVETAMRARDLMPLVKHAHESCCYIESLVLEHGLVLFCLRGLYVMAWQRAVLPRPLTSEELRPFTERNTSPGQVARLAKLLEADGLLPETLAREVLALNEVRNQAAHGVLFGEIAASTLAAASLAGLHSAGRAVDWFTTWFSNPRPLKRVPGERPTG